MGLPELLARQVDAFGSRPLLRVEEAAWSYEQVLTETAAVAGCLRAASLRPGDRVALFLENSRDAVLSWLGSGWAGTIAVAVNPGSRGPALEHVLRDSGAKLLVTEADLLPRLDLVGPLPELERIWVAGAGVPETWRGLPVEEMPQGGDPIAPVIAHPGEILTILYTGGTTGPARGVCCSHAQSYWWARNIASELRLEEEDTLHTTLPLSHTNGLHTLYQAIITGATFSLGRRFSASGFWPEIVERRATVTYLLGPLVKILLARPPVPAEGEHRLRIVLAPGTAADAWAQFVERFKVELVDAYGSTETNAITSSTRAGGRIGTMGRPLDDFEVLVVDEHDVPVARGLPGELLVRQRQPFSIFSGYWGMPEATLAATRNLWFHTRDHVVEDDDGCLRFVGRASDAIRHKGENVSAWEVEQVLLAHPEVVEAAVVAVPAELGEDDVLAFVVARNGGMLDPGELIAHCEPRLARFAVPRYIEIVNELPRTHVGRVQKFVLRERGLGSGTWDRERAGYVLSR